ncbi:MAG: DUF560 domain-containing protein [Rhizobiaceae bacterium]|nr:DUF560 domain-containing protein [Rhizobiaceae bacterium]
MFRAALLAVGTSLLSTLQPAGPLAAQPAEQTVAVTSTAQLVAVVRRLVADKRYDEARQLIAEWQPDDATYQYRVAYVEGMIQQDRGELDAAIATYRSILADRPDFTAVRYDLTQALFQAGQDDAAKYNAELLIAAGVDDQVGGGLKNIVGEINDRRPIRFRAYASFLPSTNINGGTDNSIVLIGGIPFVIGNQSKRMSGIGYMIGGEMLFRQTFAPTLSFVGSVGIGGRFYPQIERAELTFNVSAGVEKEINRGKITVSAIGRQDFDHVTPAFRSIGGRVEFSRFVGQRSRMYTSLTVSHLDYLGSTFRDGWKGELEGFVDTFLKANRFIRVLGGVETEQTETQFLSYTEGRGGLGFYTEAPWGLTLYMQGSYANRFYRGRMPFIGIPRNDDRFEGQVTVTKRDLTFLGVAPQVTYSAIVNKSNSAFDEYVVHGLDVRLVKEF